MTKKKTPLEIIETKKVAICGSAHTTFSLVPWDDLSLEVWGLAWRSDLKRFNRLFDMHPITKQRTRVPKNYPKFLSKRDVAVYLIQKHMSVPNSVTYPIEEVVEFLGPMLDPCSDGDYFASSISYMIALAIFEGYTEIRLYGIDFIDDEEYEHQRPNMEYLVGVARGLGISVYIPEKSALCKFSYRYGYETPSIGAISEDFLKSRLARYEEKHERAKAEAFTADGAAQETKQLLTLLERKKRGKAND